MSPHGCSRIGGGQPQTGNGIKLGRLKQEKLASEPADVMPVVPENHSYRTCDTVVAKEERSALLWEQSPEQLNGASGVGREQAMPAAVPDDADSGHCVCKQASKGELAASEAQIRGPP